MIARANTDKRHHMTDFDFTSFYVETFVPALICVTHICCHSCGPVSVAVHHALSKSITL
jgi:hypothetical protein